LKILFFVGGKKTPSVVTESHLTTTTATPQQHLTTTATTTPQNLFSINSDLAVKQIYG
jgi:hypothetical protein